jgi:hypothetical protein
MAPKVNGTSGFDYEVASEWLNAIGDYPKELRYGKQAGDRSVYNKKHYISGCCTPDELEQVPDLIGSNVSVVVNPTRSTDFSKDVDIVRRYWITIDIDRSSGKDLAPTDKEIKPLLDAAERITDWWATEFPMHAKPMVSRSGGGVHMLLPVDMGNTPEAGSAVIRFRSQLQESFGGDGVEIDSQTCNASRAMRLPGSVNQKFKTPVRTCVISLGSVGRRATLEEILGLLPPEEIKPTKSYAATTLPAGDWPDMPERVRRAEEYAKKIEPSISGQKGHSNTLTAALKIVKGFALSEDDAYHVLSSWNQSCQPPWSESDLRRKINEAATKTGGEWGFMFANDKVRTKAAPANKVYPTPKAASGMSQGVTEEMFYGREPDPNVDPETCDYTPSGVIKVLESDSDGAYRHLVEGFLESSQCMLVGALGSGKGCTGPMLSNHLTNGLDWWTGRPCKAGSVVIISPEDSPETIKQRCRFAGARVHGDIVDGVKIESGPRVLCIGSGSKPLVKPSGDPRSVDQTNFLDTLKETMGDLRLIVIDPVKSFMGKRGPSESEEDHVRRVLTTSLHWANQSGVAILLVIHPSKGSGSRNVNDQASGSHAWTAVTRSVVAIEKNPNYGQATRALIAGRQSNAMEGATALFDLEVGFAHDKYGNQVPVTDVDGEIELDADGNTRYVTTVRLVYRESLPQDHAYILPPFDRGGEGGANRPGKRGPSDAEIRLAACEMIANDGGEMKGYPDEALMEQMSLDTHLTDDKWLHFVCGRLARKFGLSPRTIKNKALPAFPRGDGSNVVPGFITRSRKLDFHGAWVWEAKRDGLPIEEQGVKA